MKFALLEKVPDTYESINKKKKCYYTFIHTPPYRIQRNLKLILLTFSDLAHFQKVKRNEQEYKNNGESFSMIAPTSYLVTRKGINCELKF